MKDYKIIIVPNNLKNKVIKEKENSENIKVLTFLDVKNYLYEEYSKDALYFLVTTCHLEIPVARMYINNMKYLKDEDYSDKKLEKLKIYYNILKEYKKITFNKYGSLFFKNKNIEIYGFDTFSKLELSYIDKLKSLGNVTIKNETVNLDKEIIVNEFFDIKDEVEYAAYLIAKEIESKTPVNKIYLSGIDDSSLPLVKRIFKYYNIPLPELESVNLYSTFIGKEFITLLKEKDKEEIVDILKEKYKRTAEEIKLVNSCIDILNDYSWYNGNICELYDFILDDVKNKSVSLEEKKVTINITDITNNKFNDDEFVYIIGANQGNFPKVNKDEEYISDKLSNKTLMDDSVTRNKLAKQALKQSLVKIKNLYISYRLKSDTSEFYPSAIFEELNVKINKPTINLEESYSSSYNKLKMASLLDDLKNYNKKSDELMLLTSNYDYSNYLSYSHKFNNINNFNYEPILSYTSINNYFECAFKYYLSNVLKIDEFSESFSQKVGNIYHFILRYHEESKESLKKTLEKQLEEANFTPKELVLWKPLEEYLFKFIDVLKEQKLFTDFKDEEHEKKYEFIVPNTNITIKGFIDKIISFNKDGITYNALIDYKTGNPDISIKNLKYGLGMQLPFYLYLLLNSDNKNKVVGFYLQKLMSYNLHVKSGVSLEESKKESLKLEGYTTNDEDILKHLDRSYENSELIKNLKVTKNGFYRFAKIVSDNEILEINKQVENNIKEAYTNITNGNFIINPKVIKDENISCKFCPFSDVCFKNSNDTLYLGGEEDE